MKSLATGSAIIDNHPRREEIIHDVMTTQMSIRQLCEKYDVGKSVIERFKKKLGSKAVVESRFQATASSIVDELGKIVSSCRKMLKACDDWMTDPNNPDEYDLSPRAHEVDVIWYEVGPRGGTKRHKESLQSLLNQIRRESGISVAETERNVADPRDLVLKTAAVYNKQLELALKITEGVRDSQREAVEHGDLAKVANVIISELEDYPELRERIATRLYSTLNQ